MRLVARALPRRSTRRAAREGARGAARRHGPLPRLRPARASPSDPARRRACSRRPRRGLRERRGTSRPRPSSRRSSTSLSAGLPPRVDPAAQDEFVVRFQQTCGPVMAKAIEDTAFYRYVRLVGLNEVGGDPDRFGVAAAEFHAFAERPRTTWPHDDDDAVDPRHQARPRTCAPGSPCSPSGPTEWAAWVRKARELRRARTAPTSSTSLTEYFLWQTARRRVADQRGAAAGLRAPRRSARRSCTRAWTEPDEAYEAAVEPLRRGARDDARRRRARRGLGRGRRACETRANALGQKLVQLIDARRPRRLPGHRPRRPLARRPRQPPARRLRRARRPAGPPRRGRSPRGPGRREAARHRGGPAHAA